MKHYRAYLLKNNGGIFDVRLVEAPDDDAASEVSRQYAERCDVELWEYGRKVALLTRDEKAK